MSHSSCLIYVLAYIIIYETFIFEFAAKKGMFRNYSSFIQNLSVFTKDFKNHKTLWQPLRSGKIIF